MDHYEIMGSVFFRYPKNMIRSDFVVGKFTVHVKTLEIARVSPPKI